MFPSGSVAKPQPPSISGHSGPQNNNLHGWKQARDAKFCTKCLRNVFLATVFISCI